MAEIQIFESILEIPAEDWNACVGADEPFSRHEFLGALEESGCVQPKNGWLGQHVVLRDDNAQLRACVPQFLKSHSYGEYVFDWSWADAYQRAGGKYYPKLQCAIPFTPVTGRRILLHPEATAQQETLIIQGLIARAVKLGVSSLHVTFSTHDQWEKMADQGFLKRTGHQYHWDNNDYESFDDFLDELSSRKRKSIRKERRSVAESELKLLHLSGSDITEDHWDAFYAFYLDTSGRKWGHPYLNREFFSLLGERMGEAVVLVMVENEGRMVAGALNLKGSETLFGRYWGCLEDYKFLHFETCYYQAIDHAIAHGLKRVEAGAQGQHKIKRGYLPVETYSAHWIADPGFIKPVERFLEHDQLVNREEMDALMELSPFKRPNS